MITIIRKSILLFMGLIIIYSLVLFFRNDDANSINRFLIDSDSTFLNNNKIASILKDRIKDDSSRINYNDLENILISNPHVKSVKVYKDLSGNLNVSLDQYKPVARIVSGSHSKKYIDSYGEMFPISKNFTERVILIHLNNKIKFLDNNLNNTQYGRKIMEMINYISNDDFLVKIISEIDVDNNKNIIIHPQLSKQKIIFGYPVDLDEKFNKIMLFYKRIAPLKGWNTYKTLNVKFKNQIVCDKIV